MRAPRRPPPPKPEPRGLLLPLGIAAAVLAVVAAAAALVAPRVIDWNRYRGAVAEAIEESLGRAVAIDGPISFTLLPEPRLVAERLRIANISGATDKDFATAERLELDLHAWPLLAGRLDVASLALIHPRFSFERLADGRGTWTFATAAKNAATPEKGGGIVLGLGSEGGGPVQVAIKDAAFVLRHPRLGMATIDGVDVELRGDEGDGPFHFHAAGRLDALPLSVDGSFGRLDARDKPVDFSVVLGDGIARLGVGGTLSGQGADASFDGRLTLKAAHADRLAALVGIRDAPKDAIDLSAPLTASDRGLGLQRMTVEMPGAEFAGHASLDLVGDPQFELVLAAPRLDLKPWLEANFSVAASVKPSAETSDAEAEGLERFIATPPAWLGANIDLSADIVPWHGALIRGARLSALVSQGAVTINQIGATLPGDCQVGLFGFVGGTDGRPSFDGSFETGTDDLRSLLRWLNVNVESVPYDRLGAARFTGHVTASPGRIRVDGGELRVDGTRMTTAVDLRLPTDGRMRPAFGASFAIDTLNADAYWPAVVKTAASTPMSGTRTAGATGAMPLAAGATRWLGTFDANLKGRIGRLVAGGMGFSDIDLDGTVDNGALILRSLSVADVDGAHAALSGRIAHLTGAATLDGVKLELGADDPRRLLAALALPGPAADPGPTSLTIRLDGDTSAMAVDAQLGVAGLTTTAKGKVTAASAMSALDLDVGFDASNLAGALRLLGADTPPTSGGDPLSARFHLTGGVADLKLDALRIESGPVDANGRAELNLAAKPHLDLALSAGELPLDRLIGAASTASVAPSKPLPAVENSASAAPRAAVQVGDIPGHFSRAPLGLDWMGALDAALTLDARALTWGGARIEQASLAVALTDGAATLDRFAGKLWGGDLSATAALDRRGALSAGVKLTHGDLKQAVLGVAGLDLADGSLDASFDVTATGESLAEMADRLSGSGRIEAHDGTLKGFDLAAADARLQTPTAASLLTLAQAAAGGETKFSALTGKFAATNGVIATDDLTLVAAGGTLAAAGAINLPAYAIDARAALMLDDAKGAPPLMLKLSGPLDAPRRVLDINPLQTWLAQRATRKK